MPRHQVPAQLLRLLTLGALLLPACAGTQRGGVVGPAAGVPAPGPVPAAVAPAAAAPAGGAAAVALHPQEPRTSQDFGPEVLLPDPKVGDEEVARVGEQVLRRSHAFGRLLSADPRLALSAVDLLVFDVLVAGHARQFGVQVDPERVRALAREEEKQLREQVKTEFGEAVSFEDYVWRTFGMGADVWRGGAELRVAQRLYHGYVIRYLAMCEERVKVRYIVHQDKALLEDLARRVGQGADFDTLARRHSEDAMRREGGLLPWFGRDFPHAVAEVAFQLQPGQLSEVFARESAGAMRHYLVFCLDRMAGREVSFAAVKNDIDAELQQKPLTPIEINAYTLRWRGALERAGSQPTHDKGASGR